MLGIGEKLRHARQEQGLSLRELAAKIEVSASLLSQIEHGKSNPSVQTLHCLADALSLSVDYFFPATERANQDALERMAIQLTPSQMRLQQIEAEQGQPQSMRVSELSKAPISGERTVELASPILRAQARAVIELQGNVTWSRLTPSKERGQEFMEIYYEAGAASGERMSHHRGREFFLVLEGELTLDLGFEQYVLQPGDSAIFDSETPHRLSNLTEKPMRAVSVIFDLPNGS